MSRKKVFVGLVTATVMLSGTSAALADLHVNVSGANSGAIFDLFAPPGTPDPNGSGMNYATGGTVDGAFTFDSTWNQDPFVSLNISFLNNTGIDQVFTFSASLPITQIINGTAMGGSISGSTTDADGNGLGGISAPLGGSLYTAFVDGLSVATMYDDPSSWSYASNGATTTVGPNAFGISAGTPIPGPLDALVDIGIEFSIFLSAGDSVGLNGVFVLLADPIPAPGAFALMGMAGLAGVRRRRRH